jgi:hypothetical protein
MQNFTGIYGFSALNCDMTKRAGFGLVALLALSFPALGQQPTELFTTVDSAALVHQLPMQEFLDGRLPGSTPLGRMGTAPVANFPMGLVSAAPRQKASTGSASVKDPKDGKDYSSVEAMALEKASLAFTGGEVGFMYGHSSGKFGGDEFTSYIMGGVGNDKMQINVGASYQEFNGHFSRSRP